jgi:hypothetical protein
MHSIGRRLTTGADAPDIRVYPASVARGSARSVSQTGIVTGNLREDMNRALQREFVPELRRRGFTGSLPHFRRVGDRVDLLTVQFDRHGGRFVIEIAKCDATGVTTYSGRRIPANRVTAHDLHPRERRRLGSPAEGEDGIWFRFDDGRPCTEVATSAAGFLAEADVRWAG